VREKARPPKACVVCKRPITDEQRPSVQLRDGTEVHPECFTKHKEAERRPN
jgi:hypothetical protein